MRKLALWNGLTSRTAVTAAAAVGVLMAGAIIAGASRTPSRGRVLGAFELESIFGDATCTACCYNAGCNTPTVGYGGTKCVYCNSSASRYIVCSPADMMAQNTSCSWGTTTPCGNSAWIGGYDFTPGPCGTCTVANPTSSGNCSNVVQADLGMICGHCGSGG